MTQSALGIFSAAGAGGRPTPTSPVLTNLRLWYDANDSSTITVNSGRASAITNKASGYTWTLSQGNAGRQPLIVSAAQNGKQILRYTNARQDVLANANTNHPMTNATILTWFGVYKTTETRTGYKFVIGFNSDKAFLALQLPDNKNHSQNGSNYNVLQGTNNLVNVPNILAVQQSSGSSQFLRTYTNGTILENITGTASAFYIDGTTAGGQLTSIGTGFTDFAVPNMDFCEMFMYNAVLSTDDFNDNISYLTAKWGV
jgi:hypothetical protein